MIAASLRLVAAVRAGARLVARPGSPIAHLYRGPVTRSGRYVPLAGRTVCRAHTRRLSVLEPASLGLDLGGRRVCRRCMPLLPAALGRCDQQSLPTIEDWKTTYGHLTVADVTQAGRWARTVDECHEVGTVATLVHGPKPLTPPARRTPAQQARAAMHDVINDRRRRLAEAELTDDERAARTAARDVEDFNRARIADARRREIAIARATDRANRGQYLMPHERELLATA